MKPLLCVCDLDETLLSSDKVIPEANVRAVLELQRSGVPVTIATGRSFLQIREYIDMLEVKIPVISCNGGVISMPKSEDVISVTYLNAARAKEITEFCEGNHLDYLMYTAKNICYTEGSQRICGYVKYNAALLADPTRSNEFAVPLKKMSDADECDYNEAIKILVLGSEQMLCDIADKFNYDDKLTIVTSGVGLIDIMAKSTTKGGAVQKIAKDLGIPMERVAVFGDSPNDISMFEVAGVRIAVANAVDSVKALATWVTKSNNESGVAHALAKLFEISDYSAKI